MEDMQIPHGKEKQTILRTHNFVVKRWHWLFMTDRRRPTPFSIKKILQLTRCAGWRNSCWTLLYLHASPDRPVQKNCFCLELLTLKAAYAHNRETTQHAIVLTFRFILFHTVLFEQLVARFHLITEIHVRVYFKAFICKCNLVMFVVPITQLVIRTSHQGFTSFAICN